MAGTLLLFTSSHTLTVSLKRAANYTRPKTPRSSIAAPYRIAWIARGPGAGLLPRALSQDGTLLSTARFPELRK